MEVVMQWLDDVDDLLAAVRHRLRLWPGLHLTGAGGRPRTRHP